MLEDRELLHRDAAKRVESVKYVKDCIDLVADLGGKEITIVPGLVGKTRPTASAEEEWEWAVAGLRDIYEHAGPQRRPDGARATEPLRDLFPQPPRPGAGARSRGRRRVRGLLGRLSRQHRGSRHPPVNPGRRVTGLRISTSLIRTAWPPAWGIWTGPQSSALRNVGYDDALTVEFVPSIDRTPADPYPDALETEHVEISEGLAQFIEDHGSDVVNDRFYTQLAQSTADTLLPLIR